MKKCFQQEDLTALKKLIDDDTIDPAFRALTLTLPSQDEVTQKCLDNGITPDPLVIHQSVEALNLAISNHLKTSLENIYYYFKLNSLLLVIRAQILKEPHRTEQNIHLFFIFESKNICFHFTSKPG